MKTVSLYELKRDLSSVVSEATKEKVVVTRHNNPVVELGPVGEAHLNRGSRYEMPDLRPALKGPTRGLYLKLLAQDRGSNEEEP